MREGLKAKPFTGKYGAKLEFPEGWRGAQTKHSCVGEVWIFSGTTQSDQFIWHEDVWWLTVSMTIHALRCHFSINPLTNQVMGDEK